MPLANVALTDTFDTWRTRTNQVIVSLDQNDGLTANAFGKANSANYYTYLVDANTSASFAKANSANYYTYLVDANTTAAFAKANAALANTTDITFNGNLKFTGNINVNSIQTHANNGTTGSANQVLMTNGTRNYWFPMLKIFDVNNNQIYP